MSSEIRRQFSVIARLRPGLTDKPSHFDIIRKITQQVGRYGGIYNVGIVPPNYLIHFGELNPQLHLLSQRSIAEQSFILDVLPWTQELEQCSLPWIPMKQPTAVQQNTSEEVATNDDDASDILPDTSNRPTIQGGQPNISNVYIPLVPPTEILATQPSFSYLMILEIKKFYYAKFVAANQCREAFKEIQELAQQFHDHIEPLIQSIDNETYKHTALPQDKESSAIVTFGDSLRNNVLHAAEENFDLAFTAYMMKTQPLQRINLHKFRSGKSTTQTCTPTSSAEILRYTAYFLSCQLYGTSPTIRTDKMESGYVDTHIQCSDLHHRYRSPPGSTVHEAEANAVYRFLKNATNVLGYTIADADHGTLSSVVSHLNYLDREIIDLQYSVNKAETMIADVHKNIMKAHTQLAQRISTHAIEGIQPITNDLLKKTLHFHSAAQQSSQAFYIQKDQYQSIKFITPFGPKPDETYGS